MTSRPLSLAAVACIAAFAPAVARAGTVVATGGFEAPAYTTGQLRGQQGWFVSDTGASTANVQTTIADGPGAAVRVDRAPNSDYRWAVPATGFPTGRYVSVRWSMRVEQTTLSMFSTGPFMGVEAYDAVGALGLLGSLGVDAATGDVLYQLQDTGVLIETAADVVFGAWNNFELLFDFQTDTYRGFVNGTLVAQTGFVDRAFGLNEFSDADIATFAAGADPASMALTGTAYFDNFVVYDGRVGDYNNDGVVNAADYTVWRDTQGTTGSQLQADGNANRTVDAPDYALWVANYGTAGAATAVPEPGAIALLALAGLCPLARARRAAR
ncbi:MAG: hypothetical protein ACRCT8_05815 [Lacipirellulaceae bacterium]